MGHMRTREPPRHTSIDDVDAFVSHIMAEYHAEIDAYLAAYQAKHQLSELTDAELDAWALRRLAE